MSICSYWKTQNEEQQRMFLKVSLSTSRRNIEKRLRIGICKAKTRLHLHRER
jgi:hypothetical protein